MIRSTCECKCKKIILNYLIHIHESWNSLGDSLQRMLADKVKTLFFIGIS